MNATNNPHTVATRLKAITSRLFATVSESLLPAGLLGRVRSRREWMNWVDSLTSDSLKDLTGAPAEVKRRLFKKHVHLVEIETHARCNRICSFCPNVIADRRRDQNVADRHLLDRVFAELGSIGYDRQIKVARYSEPLANIDYLCGRLAAARRLAPSAQLAIVTNTDYLTVDVLRRLREVGLNVVYMSLYLKPHEVWTRELAHQYCRNLADRLATHIKRIDETSQGVRCGLAFENLDLRAACMNFDIYGTDRGGAIERYTNQERIGPCREPFETFVIDYSGAVVPCCNVRSDLAQHRDLVVADLSIAGTSIFDVYAGQLSAWRRSMVQTGRKEFPCTTCRHREVPEHLAATVSARLEGRLRRR